MIPAITTSNTSPASEPATISAIFLPRFIGTRPF
jgi:hypothetical protein